MSYINCNSNLTINKTMQKTMHSLDYIELDESGLDDDLEEFSEIGESEDDELEYDEEQY